VPREIERVLTSDGSYTCRSAKFDECYHSTRDGALKESLHKHVIPAFSLVPEMEEYRILDICFGLGYNTWTTIFYLRHKGIKRRLKIYSPEMDRDLVASLADFEYPEEFGFLADIIRCISTEGRYESDTLCIELLFGDARETIGEIGERVDIVYQDPFSPAKNPLLWTREYFAQIAALSTKETVLTTYSSATPVRMGLYENGFNIYETPSEDVRRGTVASFASLDLKVVDMELKKQRNPQAASLRDSDFGSAILV